MSVFLIALMIFLYTMQSFLCKKYTDCYPGNPQFAAYIFTIVSGFIIAVASFAVSGFSFDIDKTTLLLALFNTLAVFLYDYMIVKCSQNGPYSVLIVFNLGGGIIVPALVAHFAYKEYLTIGKIISIVIIIAAMYLISRKEKSGNEKITLPFLIYCFLLMIANGCYGTLLDLQQRMTGVEHKEEMVALTFFGAAVLSTILILIKSPKEFLPSFKQTKLSLTFLLTCSAVAASAVTILSVVLSMVNVTVLYTFDNAGVLLLSVVLSAVFLKEKMSKLNIFGCVIMLLGLIGVSIF